MVQQREVQAEVVISGIGGYFPRSVNIDDFKDLLLENVHMQDPARWKAGQLDVCDTTSNIPNIDCFDASYFGIHRQQCTYMDPMQRTVLEKTFEAIIDAGLNPSEIRGKKIGVYMGSCISENDSLMFESVENGFGITGQARTMLANRISYWLNVTGPSCSFDVSWTNGAQVMQFALEAIRSGQCEAAVVGTTNLALNIYPTWLYKSQGFTSNDGVTRAFDENAEGYSRGEAIIALFLQRSDCSKRCYATVMHADAQFNGIRSGNFTHIDLTGMTKFLTEFYSKTDVDVNDIHYVETYGCGIKKIDEVEIAVIEKIFCKDRKTPLLVGSVKTNAGHSEAAEAFMSLVKTIIAMETGIIPATLHHTTPNRNIPALLNGKIEVVTTNKPWVGKYAAINSIGLASSFGHILLRANPKTKVPINTDLPLLRVVSTRTEDGIKEILKVLSSDDSKDQEYARLIHDVFASNIVGHLYRGYILHGEKVKEEFEHFTGSKTQTWFVYSGMGSQWLTMGKDLMAVPIFAEAINKCHDILIKKGVDLKHVISTDDPNIFDNILHSFVGIAAIQIGLTDILHAIGIVPDGIIGHSVGELGCAYADGGLSAEQMILCAYYRGKASLECELIKGTMAAIGLGAEAIKKIVPETIDVACHNGPDSSTLSGPAEDMEKFVGQLQEKGVFARLVNVSNIAYHSRYIRPAAPLLLKYLEDIIPEPVTRSSKWLSTSIQESEWSTDLAKTTSAEYLTNNLLSSVYFSEGCRHIPPGAIVIEIAPHGLLQAILRRSLAPGCVNVPLTKRGSSHPVEFLMTAFGKLFLSGMQLNLAPLYPTVTFPVSRGTKSLTPLVRWEHSGKWRTGLEEFKDYSFTEKYYLITINSEEFRDLVGHQIDGKIVIPVAAYLMLVVDVLSNVKRVESAVFENIFIRKNVEVSQKGSASITVMVQRGSGDFEISEGQNIIATGKITVPELFKKELLNYPSLDGQSEKTNLSSEEFYRELQHRGYDFNGLFKSVTGVNIYTEGDVAKISWLNSWPAFISSMIQLQLLHAGESNQNLLMPASILRIAINLERQQEMNNEIDVVFHESTGLISSNMAQIAGINFAEFPLENKQILINDFKFVNFIQNEIQDIRTGLNTFLEIALQNVINIEDLQITEVKDNFSESLEKYVRDFFDYRCGKQVKMDVVEDVKDCATYPHSTIVIMSEDKIKEAYFTLKQYTEFVLVYLSKDKNFYLNYPITMVSSFNFEGRFYKLLKTAKNVIPIVIEVPLNESINERDSWVVNMKNSVSAIKNDDNKRIYLVSYALPSQGIEEFCNKIKSICETDALRVLYILDNEAPKCHNNDKFYQHIYHQDLKLSIYSKGHWGTYMNMVYPLLTVPEKIQHTKVTEVFSKSSVLSQKQSIRYMTMDPRDFAPTQETNRREYVGYSALNSDGTKMMGVARLDLQEMKTIPDPYLQWPVPDHWTLTDAVTVPLYYSMAFSVIGETCRIEPREAILVHDGCSSFGQAAIAVANSFGCLVYTTVGSDQQRAFLLAKFAELSNHRILDYEDFENDIMTLTNGEGVNIILNCFGGERLRATIRCLAVLGKIIHYRINEIDDTDFIGLSIFLKCTCMSAVTPRKIFNTTVEIKKNLHSWVSQAIETSYVKPLERRIFESFDSEKILSYLQNPDVVSVAVVPIQETERTRKLRKIKDVTNFKCDANGVYVIFGDSSEIWLNLVEWLIFHGAKKVSIMTSGSIYPIRRLTLLKEYHKAQIQFTSKKQTSTNIADFLHETTKSGPIVSIFILPSNGSTDINMNIAYSIDVALNTIESQKQVDLICVWGTEKELCYKSINGHTVVCNINWEDSRKFKDLLKVLDKILEIGGNVTLRNEQQVQQEKIITSKDFCLLLPQTLSVLKRLSENLPKELCFNQLVSSCPRVVREIPPVFIVPGLAGANCPDFRHLVRNLMHPIHCVTYGQRLDSFEKQANKVIKDILHIQPKGPYNLIAVSWGGALTLEVARKLEETGAQTQLFLVDAVPDTMQAIISSQGTGDILYIQTLVELLGIKDPKDIKFLLSISDWPNQVKHALKLANISEKDHKTIQYGMDYIKQHVDQMFVYQYLGKMINGPTKLFRPQNSSKDDSFGLTKYCKEVEIKIFTGNHLTMMQDKTLIEYINDNILI